MVLVCIIVPRLLQSMVQLDVRPQGSECGHIVKVEPRGNYHACGEQSALTISTANANHRIIHRTKVTGAECKPWSWSQHWRRTCDNNFRMSGKTYGKKELTGAPIPPSIRGQRWGFSVRWINRSRSENVFYYIALRSFASWPPDLCKTTDNCTPCLPRRNNTLANEQGLSGSIEKVFSDKKIYVMCRRYVIVQYTAIGLTEYCFKATA